MPDVVRLVPVVPDALVAVKPEAAFALWSSWQTVKMPQEPPTPTDSSREAAMGRVALWLDPEDLRWLAARCYCADDAAELERERCARVRFRASAALHKAEASGE